MEDQSAVVMTTTRRTGRRIDTNRMDYICKVASSNISTSTIINHPGAQDLKKKKEKKQKYTPPPNAGNVDTNT